MNIRDILTRYAVDATLGSSIWQLIIKGDLEKALTV